MTEEERELLSRRALLRRAALLGGTDVIPVLSVDHPALAEQKVPQDWVHYGPRADTDCICARCALFLAGETPDASGVCRLVAGLISPRAHCDAFAAAAQQSRA